MCLADPGEKPNAQKRGVDRRYDELLDGLRPYSALRDPAAREVRVFLDAEQYVAEGLGGCYFRRVVDGYAEHLDVPGKLRALLPDQFFAHRARFDGYMLSCADPGPEYGQLYLRFHSQFLLRMEIETIETTLQGGVCACVGPIYTNRSSLSVWLQHNIALGIEGFFLYRANLHKPERLGGRYTVIDTPELRNLLPVNAVPDLPYSVSWFVYTPPPRRWYFGQTTMYNECIFRNRAAYRYVMVMDVDEFLTIQPASAAGTPNLLDFLDRNLPSNVGSLIFKAVNYPMVCQPQCVTANASIQAEGPSPVRDCRMYATIAVSRAVGSGQSGPKSIVRPLAVGRHGVHRMLQASGKHLRGKVVQLDYGLHQALPHVCLLCLAMPAVGE